MSVKNDTLKCLSREWKTVEEILEELNEPKSSITSSLSKLCRQGRAEKTGYGIPVKYRRR